MAGAMKGQGRRSRRDALADPPLPLGGAPDERAEASWDVGPAARAPHSPRRSRSSQPAPQAQPGERRATYPAFPYIAGALAAALIAIGIASYLAANLLGGAVRAAARRGAETPAALAATVCHDLTQRDYTDLVARIDPNPAPPAITSTSLDASAMANHLMALDGADGHVTSCAAQPLTTGQVALTPGPDGATRLLLTIWRENTPRPIAAVLITRQSPDSAWLVERDSSFLLAN